MEEMCSIVRSVNVATYVKIPFPTKTVMQMVFLE